MRTDSTTYSTTDMSCDAKAGVGNSIINSLRCTCVFTCQEAPKKESQVAGFDGKLAYTFVIFTSYMLIRPVC